VFPFPSTAASPPADAAFSFSHPDDAEYIIGQTPNVDGGNVVS
jgi:hypothetical protein